MHFPLKIFSAFENPENALNFGTGNAVFHKETVHSDKNRIADKNVEEERENNKEEEHNAEIIGEFLVFKKTFKSAVFGHNREYVAGVGHQKAAENRCKERSPIAKAAEHLFCFLFKFRIFPHKNTSLGNFIIAPKMIFAIKNWRLILRADDILR